jgi:hypothetical protein
MLRQYHQISLNISSCDLCGVLNLLAGCGVTHVGSECRESQSLCSTLFAQLNLVITNHDYISHDVETIIFINRLF